MSPAVGIGLFIALFVGLHLVQALGKVLRAVAAEAEKETARRAQELHQRRAELEARGRQREARRAPVARPVAPRRRDDAGGGGHLDRHHLSGGLDDRHLAHLSTQIDARQPLALAAEQRELDDLGAPPGDASASGATLDPAVAGLHRLEALPIAARGFVLSQVFGPPRGRIRPRLLGVRSVDG